MTKAALPSGALLLLLGAPIEILGGQEVTVVAGARPACRTCQVVIERQAVLRMPESQPALVSPFNFALDSAGNLYFADPFGSIGVRVFDKQGRYLRTVGTRGQGPGEFMSIASLSIGPGDSLHVFHAGHSVFTSAGRHVRTQTLLDGASVKRAVPLPDGGFIVNASLSTPSAYGYPFHLVNRQGQAVKSFGRAPNEAPAPGFWGGRRPLATPVNGRFWAARTNAYELEQYSVDGQRLKVVRRDVDWFKPWRDWKGEPDVAPAPPPRIMSVAEDPRTGYLWVLLLVADERWKARSPGGRERAMHGTGELIGLFDAMIEVIDPGRGALIASRRFPNFFVEFVAAGVLADLAELDGETVVNIWTMRLTGQRDR